MDLFPQDQVMDLFLQGQAMDLFLQGQAMDLFLQGQAMDPFRRDLQLGQVMVPFLQDLLLVQAMVHDHQTTTMFVGRIEQSLTDITVEMNQLIDHIITGQIGITPIIGTLIITINIIDIFLTIDHIGRVLITTPTQFPINISIGILGFDTEFLKSIG